MVLLSKECKNTYSWFCAVTTFFPVIVDFEFNLVSFGIIRLVYHPKMSGNTLNTDQQRYSFITKKSNPIDNTHEQHDKALTFWWSKLQGFWGKQQKTTSIDARPALSHNAGLNDEGCSLLKLE